MRKGPISRSVNWLKLNADWLEWLAAPGTLAVCLAIYAGWADRKRMRRSDPDAVGLVSWSGVAFWASLAAVVLLGLAGRAWWLS